MLDPVFLSRIQFAWVITYHIIFPAFTIGLASWIVFLEFQWLRTRSEKTRDLLFFWLHIFAISFGVGVVTGIVMSFQFGTNWALFTTKTGNIIGPLLNYEVLTAFFIEATFLGVMIFGWNRVSERVHFACSLMVALGTLVSTFWIMSANSWMQTPVGYIIKDGIFYPADWFEIIFNPSFINRLLHMVAAAFLTTAFMIGGISASYILRGKFIEKANWCLKCAIIFVAIVAPLQVLIGDLTGQDVRKYQPAKLAAIEAHWHQTDNGMPLVLFGIPNEATESNDYAINVPRLGSLILTHSWNGTIEPITSFAPENRPPIAITFFSFRIMVGLGILMLILAWWGAWKIWRKQSIQSKLFLRAWQCMIPAGFIALVAGWWVAEIGRQPWTVYNLLRTADSASSLPVGSVVASLAIYIILYLVLFIFVIVYLLKIIRKGPIPTDVTANKKGIAAIINPSSIGADK